METFWNELNLEAPDAVEAARIVRVAARLLLAALLGGLLGLNRERLHKAAGLRTHMLVALGSAAFVLAPQQAGLDGGDLTRVIQGIAAGIGFLGAGTILKLAGEQEIHGLTTAASIWLTAAVGIAAGAGWYGTAVLAAGLAWAILSMVASVERWLGTDTRLTKGPDA